MVQWLGIQTDRREEWFMTELMLILMPIVFVGLMIAIGTRHMPATCLNARTRYLAFNRRTRRLEGSGFMGATNAPLLKRVGSARSCCRHGR